MGARQMTAQVANGSAARGPRFLSVAAVARILGVSDVTLYRAIAAGEFPAVRIRGRLIVPAGAVEAMAETAIAEQTVVDAAGWPPGAGLRRRAGEA
jgi:excisionase family DNA binding protein